MVTLWSLLFACLVSIAAAGVFRRSNGVDHEVTVEDELVKPSEPSGYYFPDNAPDITKDDYGSQQDAVTSGYEQMEVTASTASNQGISSDWRPQTPSPPPSDGVLPNREMFTLIPQTPDTDYPVPEWAGKERTTPQPATTTPRWTSTTTTSPPWWETTTTQRPWWETTDRPWWETTTTQRPWFASYDECYEQNLRWETSTTQMPWWRETTERPRWSPSTTWQSTSTQRPYYEQREQVAPSRRLPIPRRSSRGCRMLNPLVDGKPHPDNDGSCIQNEVIQSGCSCRYLRGENDALGCARYFLTLCSRR